MKVSVDERNEQEAAQIKQNRMMDKDLETTDRKAIDMYNEIATAAQEQYQKNGKVKNDYFKKLRRFLTDFSVDSAQEQFKKWTQLEQTLLVKFIDGNIKEQDSKGNFIRSKTSDKLPGKISQPGYSEKWKEAVVADHGNVIKVIESPSED